MLFFSSTKQDLSLFLHCVASRLEENGNWYSRMHLGPFLSGSRLQIGTRLRRSILNDLSQTSITAVELEGAVHEFSRLPGIHEPVLDFLFQLRKVALHAPFLKLGETTIVSFLVSGPGTFYAKDLSWPTEIECRTPEIRLVTLAPGAILRGRLLIHKYQCFGSIDKYIKPLRFGEGRSSLDLKIKKTYPWLSLGSSSSPVKRVGFRIESIDSLNQKNEILIFEILTNGSISPRQALREAAFLLVYKFSAIAYLMLFLPNKIILPKSRKKIRFKHFLKHKYLREKILGRNRTFYDIFNVGFYQFWEPLGLDLGNIELSKERYFELQSRGFQTLGQVLERMTFETSTFSPFLKKQIQQSLFHLGFFPYLN